MKLRSLMAAAVVAAASCASGSAMAVTAGSIGPGNDGLAPLGLNNPLGGYFGADIHLVGGTADIVATVLGSEAGYKNYFGFYANIYNTAGSTNSFVPGGVTSFLESAVAPGLLDFWFGSNGMVNLAVNGSNPDNTTSGLPNFFVSFLPNPTATFGQSVLLFFDDAGAGVGGDDNHDDLIVRLDVRGDGRIAPVPVPAAGLMLIAALGGLAAVRRRKSA